MSGRLKVFRMSPVLALAIFFLTQSIWCQVSQHGKAYQMRPLSSSLVPMTMEPLVFPMFLENTSFTSHVSLVNGSGIAGTAVVQIYDESGRLRLSRTVAFPPHGRMEKNIKQWLTEANTVLEQGSIQIVQGKEFRRPAVLGQLTLSRLGTVEGASAEEEIAMPTLLDSQSLRGVSEAGNRFLGVASLVNEAQTITVECRSKATLKTVSTSLVGHGAWYGDPCADPAFAQDPVAIELRTDGPNGGMAAFALVTDPKHPTRVGSVSFIDPQSLHSRGYAYAGIASQSSLSADAHPVTPRVLLGNFTDRGSIANVTVSTTSTAGLVKQVRNSVTLQPRSVTEFFIPMTESGLGSLTIDSDLSGGDLVTKLISQSADGSTQIEQLAKDLYDYRNGGTHPWSVAGSYSSELVIFNHSDSEQIVHYAVVTQTGRMWQGSVRLGRHATQTVDIKQLTRQHSKDARGTILEETDTAGTISWFANGPGLVSARLLVRGSGILARSFSCGQTITFCGMGIAIDPPNPDSSGLYDVGQTLNAGVTEQDMCVDYSGSNSCSGDFWNSGFYYLPDWDSSNEKVATVSPSQGTFSTNVSVVGGGSTVIGATAYDNLGCVAQASLPITAAGSGTWGGTFVGPLSYNDYLSFSNSSSTCRSDLGLGACTAGIFWNVELEGSVNDDVASWEVQQSDSYHIRASYIMNGTVYSAEETKPAHVDGPDSNFLQKIAGDKTLFTIDDPGLSRKAVNGADLDHGELIHNLNTSMCTPNLSSPVRCITYPWHIKIVINAGGAVDASQSEAGPGNISAAF